MEGVLALCFADILGLGRKIAELDMAACLSATCHNDFNQLARKTAICATFRATNCATSLSRLMLANLFQELPEIPKPTLLRGSIGRVQWRRNDKL